MANLVRLTVNKSNVLTDTGSYSFNTFKIKKVYASGTGSIVFYKETIGSKNKTIKLEVDEAPATVNASLTGGVDFGFGVSVFLGNGNTRTETIKVSDIIYCREYPGNSSYTIMLTEEDGELKINSSLSDIETLVNDRNEDYVQATGIKLDSLSGRFYNTITQNGAITFNVDQSGVIGAGAMQPVIVDGSLITVNYATKDPKSDDASLVVGDTDRYVFWKDTLGVYYSITNLGQ